MARSVLAPLGICIAGAVLETLCSGAQVEQRFEELRFPTYSLPLWSWFAVGVLYYIMCYFVLYRILVRERSARFRRAALSLILALMATNALWNLVFFRTDQMLLAFIGFIPYALLALGLLITLWRFDRPVAWVVVPYLVYLIYACTWGYGLWQLNGSA